MADTRSRLLELRFGRPEAAAAKEGSAVAAAKNGVASDGAAAERPGYAERYGLAEHCGWSEVARTLSVREQEALRMFLRCHGFALA
jgi:hypothetical protein